jgi:hypothetical protein
LVAVDLPAYKLNTSRRRQEGPRFASGFWPSRGIRRAVMPDARVDGPAIFTPQGCGVLRGLAAGNPIRTASPAIGTPQLFIEWRSVSFRICLISASAVVAQDFEAARRADPMFQTRERGLLQRRWHCRSAV